MATLVLEDGRELTLRGNEVVVGRATLDDDTDEPLDLNLGDEPNGDSVSRRQARFFSKDGVWRIEAAPATNPTIVAGHPVAPGQVADLHDRDELWLAGVRAIFHSNGTVAEVTQIMPTVSNLELRADGQTFRITLVNGQSITVGRRSPADASADVDLGGLRGARTIAHRQVTVSVLGDRWSILAEAGATNPTRLNGAILPSGESAPLRDGDSLQLGRVALSVHEMARAQAVGSDEIELSVDPITFTIEPGATHEADIVLTNHSRWVHWFTVHVAGLRDDWYYFVAADGSRAASWGANLQPSVVDPLNSSARARLVIAPPRRSDALAGTYQIVLTATTRDDALKREVSGAVTVLPFQDLTLSAAPVQSRGTDARIVARVDNLGNARADVALRIDAAPDLKSVVPTPDLVIEAGGSAFQHVKVRPHRLHWLGPDRVYPFKVFAAERAEERAQDLVLTCPPRVPLWLQHLWQRILPPLKRLAAFAVPLGLLALAYVFLIRPPDVDFRVATDDVTDMGAGTLRMQSDDVQPLHLLWTVDRGAGGTLAVTHGTPISRDLTFGAGETGSQEITPNVSTEYTLTARNWLGFTTTRTVAVDVVHIDSFAAVPDRIAAPGQEVTLQWKTEGAKEVSIAPSADLANPTGLAAEGQQRVFPAASSNTYTLTASDDQGHTVQKSVLVETSPPVISSFELDPQQKDPIYAGGRAQLSWTGSGISTVVIEDVSGADVVPGQNKLTINSSDGRGSATIQPDRSGLIQYRLTASNVSNVHQPVERYVTVKVDPIRIVSFNGPEEPVVLGNPVRLTWQIEGASAASRIEISPSVGSIAASANEVQVQPAHAGDATYTLRVFTANPNADPITQSVTVTVKSPPPSIDTFEVDKTDVQQGDLVNITWKTAENLTRTLIITEGDHEIRTQLDAAAGSMLYGPQQATRYTLEVRNADDPEGDAVRITREVTVHPKAPSGAAGGAGAASDQATAAEASQPADASQPAERAPIVAGPPRGYQPPPATTYQLPPGNYGSTQ